MAGNIIRSTRKLRISLILLALAAMMILPPGVAPVKADMVTTTVPVGDFPMGVAVNETTNKIYVTGDDGKVTVIDGATYTTIKTLTLGGSLRGVVVDVTNNKVYVAYYGGSRVTVIDGSSDTITGDVAVASYPDGMACDQATSKIYVTHNTSSGSLTVIDGVYVDHSLPVDQYPDAVAVDKNTNTIYVAHEGGTVTVIDGSSLTITTTLAAGSFPRGVAVNPDTKKIYVANSNDSTVTVIDGNSNTVVGTVAVGGAPADVAVNAVTNRIYVANQTGQSVTVIDGTTNNVLQTLAIQGYGGPNAVAVDQARNTIYVPSVNVNNVTVIDGAAIEGAGVTGLTAPVTGAAPESAGALSAGDSRYTVTGLTWQNIGGSAADLDGGGNFANPGCTYQASIELTAEPGYKFPAGGLTPAADAGIPTAGTVSGGDVTGNKLTFVVTFPANITAAGITGLVAPATGATPIAYTDLSAGDPAQYSITSLTWENYDGSPATLDGSGKFLCGGSGYQARIKLTSQLGYKFPAGGLSPAVDGDGAVYAAGTVEGGDVSGNTLTFLVQFPEDIPDSYVGVTGLIPPAAGGTPQTAGDLNIYYSGYYTVTNLTWKNSDGSPATLDGSGKFLSGGSTYRAEIELTSEPGCKFPLNNFPVDLQQLAQDDGIYLSGAVSGGYVSGNKFTYLVAFSEEIAAAGITGLVAPATGATPMSAGDLTVNEPAKYMASAINWENSDGSPATLTGGKFNAGSIYKAEIMLGSQTGYKFPLNGLTPAVDAGTPTAGTIGGGYYCSGNLLYFEVTFPATASATTYKAVTGITGVPAAGTPGAEIDLTGATVSPADATNQTIVWTVKDAGTTGVTTAALATGKFTPVGAGTLVLTATIANGATESSDYTRDFTISVAGSGGGGGGGVSLAPPVITPNGGTITASQAISITDPNSSTVGNSVYYTFDGLTPTLQSTLYTAPFTLSQSATVTAAVYNDSTGLWSTSTGAAFTIASPVQTYALTITAGAGGSITTGSSGNYAEGDVIGITATANSGYSFKQWTSTGGGIFVNANSAGTTFTMPAGPTTITANFTYNGGSSGGGSSGGGGSSPHPVSSSTGSATVTPSEGGSVSLDGDVALKIPANVLQGNNSAQVGIQKVDTPPSAPSGFMVLGNVYQFTVNDQDHYSFKQPVTLTFTFDPSGLAPGQTPAVYYYDENEGRWVDIGGTVSGNTITVTVDHFTRFAVLAKEAAPQPEQKPVAALSDIADHWAEKNIEKLIAMGVVSGYPNGTFRPDGSITRAEFTALLVKAFKLQGKGDKVFADTAGHWAREVIATAASCGIIGGYDQNTFGPDDPVTREQMAVMTVKAAKISQAAGETAFTDREKISSWARESVSTAVRAGIIKGYSNNTFLPGGKATRAEAVTIIVNALK